MGYMHMEMKGMSQVGYIFIGFLFGVLSMLIARWLQAKEYKKNYEIEIISDTLKYLFSTKQKYNNLLTDRSVFEKTLKEFPEKSNEIEKQMYEKFDREIEKDFFPQLMFHSFQLNRLEDKSFWKDFEKMMAKYEAFGKMIIEQAEMVRISQQNTELMALTKNFVDKCLAKAKV